MSTLLSVQTWECSAPGAGKMGAEGVVGIDQATGVPRAIACFVLESARRIAVLIDYGAMNARKRRAKMPAACKDYKEGSVAGGRIAEGAEKFSDPGQLRPLLE